MQIAPTTPMEMEADWLPDEAWDGLGLGYVPRGTIFGAHCPPLFSAPEQPDAVSYQVLRWKLWNINLEHSDTIRRVSGAPAIVYMDDFATSILTARGENVVTGTTIQYFTGLADLIVKWTLEHRSEVPGIMDGDVFLQNDPWIGAAHQIDTALYMPVFWQGELVCWLFNAAHQGDLGGISPGSFCAGACDVFDEPTPVPPVKVVRSDVVQDDVVALFTRKSRTPDMVALQLRSQIAGLRAARRRMLDLLERYGPAVVAGTMEQMIADCGKAFAERLAQIPDGTFSEVIDVAGIAPGDTGVHRYRLEIVKQGTLLYCSNAGTDEQFVSGNCTYSAWRSAIVCAASTLFGHDQLSCPGGILTRLRFRPVPGLLTCARFPAAVTTIISTTVSVNLANLVLGKIALLGPRSVAEVAIGSGAGAILNSWVLSGLDAHGRRVADVNGDGIAGGFAASRYRDGIDNGGAWFMPGNVSGDAEEWEQALPVLYLYRREATDTGGAGRQRGGNALGAALCGHKTTDCSVITLNVDTSVNATPGLAGGLPAHSGSFYAGQDRGIDVALGSGRVPANRAELEELTGAVSRAVPMSTLRLLPSDVFLTQVCSGGGFGDALAREPELLAADVADRHVSERAALDIYGVVLADGAADLAATAERRAQMRAERLARADPPGAPVPAPAPAQSGGPVLQVGDALALRGSAADAQWHCRDCDHGIAPVQANYKDHAAVLRLAVTEFPATLYPPPPDHSPGFEMRHYLCPSCATILATEFCRAGEPHRHDIAIDPATLASASALAFETAA
jgi:N-methylhydantoinase B